MDLERKWLFMLASHHFVAVRRVELNYSTFQVLFDIYCFEFRLSELHLSVVLLLLTFTTSRF